MRPSPSSVCAGLRSVRIEGRTDGLILEITLDHQYWNGSSEPVEVVYSFPVPSDAAVLGVMASVNSREVPTRWADQLTAEAQYEDAQLSGRFAALVERTGPGLCTASLGRLQPGETASLHTVWAQFLERTHDGARISIPASAVAPEGSREGGPLGPPRSSLLADYDVSLGLLLTGPAQSVSYSSPTHQIVATHTRDGLRLELNGRNYLDRDIVILLPGLSPCEGVRAMIDGRDVAAVSYPSVRATQSSPKNLQVWIDAAGPLGPRLRDAGEFLCQLLQRLGPEDLVSIERLGRATAVIAPLAPNGESRINEDLLRTMSADLGDLPIGSALPVTPRAGADLFLITDGRTRVAEAVCEAARVQGCRLFVLGAGAAPSEGVLRPAALATGGDYVALAPFEVMEPALNRIWAGVSSRAGKGPKPGWDDVPAWLMPLSYPAAVNQVMTAGFQQSTPFSFSLRSPDGAGAVHYPLRELSCHRDPLAGVLLALTLRLAMQHNKSDSVEEWARHFHISAGKGSWLAVSDRADPGAKGREAKLVVAPQMSIAGDRGLGKLSPIPPPPRPVEPRDGRVARPMSIWARIGKIGDDIVHIIQWCLRKILGKDRE